RIAWRRHALLVAPGNIHRIQRRSGIAAWVAEKHDDPAVRRKCRAFVVESLGQDTLTGSIGFHDADGEFALRLARERNVVAARRPHRRGIAAVAKADALRSPPAGAHHINLLLATATGFKANPRTVGRIRRRGVDRLRVGEPRGRLRTQIHYKKIRVAALLQAHDHALPVGGKAWREAHAGKVADDFALAGFDIVQIDAR